MAQAADSGNDAVSDTSMTFHESSTDSKQTEALKDIIHEKIDSDKSSTTPELCISLDEKLQWFFSFEKLDFINDPYENNDYYNYRATFGIHIAL